MSGLLVPSDAASAAENTRATTAEALLSPIGSNPGDLPTGYTAQTIARSAITNVTINVLVSGDLLLTHIWLPVGTVVNNIIFWTGSTPATGPNHWWFGLYDSNYNQLAVTADSLTAAIPANSEQVKAITTVASGAASSFTTTYSGWHYLGRMCIAGTVPTATGNAGATNVNAKPPLLNGIFNTGLTGGPPAFPFQATFSGNSTTIPYMATS